MRKAPINEEVEKDRRVNNIHSSVNCLIISQIFKSREQFGRRRLLSASESLIKDHLCLQISRILIVLFLFVFLHNLQNLFRQLAPS